MNLQIEMAHEPWLFEAGLDLSLQLDKRFAITRKFRVLSQRDVPGIDICFISNEHELTFTFAICCRPSFCLLSVVCLVCNARAPYSGGCNFWQYFYSI